MKKIAAIVPAAGSGVRLGYKISKPYIQINGHPLLFYPLAVLQNSAKIKEIIVAVEKDKISLAKKLVVRYKFNKIKIVVGGASRSESVKKGISAVTPDTDFILIHDGARPFLTKKILDRCINAVIKNNAVICGLRCSSTIKTVDKNQNVISTLDRNKLWQVQTPQVFAYGVIKLAYAKMKNKKNGFFDDAALVEKLPYKVKMVEGANTNIKITTAEDLKIAKALLNSAYSG